MRSSIRACITASLLSLLTCFSAQANEETHHEWLQQIGLEFWAPFQIKLLKIIDSYAVRVSKDHNRIEFYSNDEVECNGTKVKNTHSVAAIQFSIAERRDGATTVTHQAIDYFGCHEKHLFSEEILTEGENITPLSVQDIFLGKRQFSLAPNEMRKIISFTNPHDSKTFVSLASERSGSGITTSITTDSQSMMDLFYDKESQTNMLAVHSYMAIFSVGTAGRMTFNYMAGPSREIWITRAYSHNPLYFYRDTSGAQLDQEISLSLFKTKFKELALHRLIVGKYFLEHMDKYHFPAADFGSSGSANTRLLEELQKAVELLRIGGRTDEVINLLLRYIEAAQKNELQDFRQVK